MKAAVLYGPNDFRIEEIEKPKIKSDEVLVKVMYTGVCGTDFPKAIEGKAKYYPIVLGHEFSGELVEVGKEAKDLYVGDNVSGVPLIPCFECEQCSKGNYSLCNNYSYIGARQSGSFAEYVKIPWKNAVKINKIPLIQGVFLEPITVALHGILLMDFKGTGSAAVVGAGTIGLLAIQCLKILGAKEIIVFDLDEHKLEVAKKLGATVCINTLSKNIDKKISDKGIEWVVETAGTEFTEKLSLKIASKKGKVMLIGRPTKTGSIIPEEFELIQRKELTIKGSWMSYSPPFPGIEWDLANYYLSTGEITVDKLIDRIVPLEDISNAFKDIEENKIKGKVMFEI